MRRPGPGTGRREPSGQPSRCGPALLAPAVFAALRQVPPVIFGDVNVVAPGRRADALPGPVALRVAHALDLIKARDRVAHVPRVAQRLLALLRERELRVVQAVLLGGAQALGLPRHLLPVRPLALHLARPGDVLPGGRL